MSNINQQNTKPIDYDRELTKVNAEITMITKKSEMFTVIKEMKANGKELSQQQSELLEKLERDNPENERRLGQLKCLLDKLIECKSEHRPLFKFARVEGEEGEDGNFHYYDEDEYIDFMLGPDEDSDAAARYSLAGDVFFEKVDNENDVHFKEMRDELKAQGYDTVTLARKAPSSTEGKDILPHQSCARSALELLKAAKLGDLETLRNEESIEGIDVHNFFDNNRRNALHYAADSGSIKVVSYLLDMKGMSPLSKDKDGLSPLNIAVILNRSDCIDIMLEYIKKKSDASGSVVSPDDLNKALLIEKYTPNPPKMVLSKGAPALPRHTVPKGFWGTSPPEEVHTAIILDIHDPDFKVKECQEFFAQHSNGIENSFYTWLTPISHNYISNAPVGSYCIQTPANDVYSLVVPLPSADLVTKMPVASKVAIVNHLTLAQQYRGNSDGIIIFNLTRDSLLEKGVNAAIFTSQAVSPAQVTTPTCRVKWFCRVLSPLKIIDNTTRCIVDEVYPDFHKHESVLRVDMYLKSMFGNSNNTALMSPNIWIDVHAEGTDGRLGKALLDFINKQLISISGCHMHFHTVSDLQGLLRPCVVYCCVVPSSIKEDTPIVTDVVMFVERSSRDCQADLN
eukprot:Tbor_TRINITY_DN5139_c4_g1::TRINITY_DN5139_c4_g1_i1::g.25725::m.25725